MPPSFTVVVPTRERADTLKHTIGTCLAQTYNRLRVLVSDNYSSDTTPDVVRSFRDNRLAYIRTERRLDMAGNWEFALNHVDTDFVTYLGDDDGLLLGSVALAATLLTRHELSILTWQKAEYCWPDHVLTVYRNYLEIPLSLKISLKECKLELSKLRRFLVSYASLPCIYNSFVSVPLLRTIQERSGGRLFRYSAPDVYSSLILAANCDRYIWSSIPFSINGASRHSTGTASMHALAKAQPAKTFVEESNYSLNGTLPSFAPSVDISVAEAMDAAAKAFPETKKLFEYETKDLIRYAYLRASSRTPEVYVAVLGELRKRASLWGLDGFLQDLESAHKNEPIPIAVKYGYSRANQNLTVNAASIGIKNVFDASLFVSEVLSPAYEQAATCSDDLVDQGETKFPTWRSALALAFRNLTKGGL